MIKKQSQKIQKQDKTKLILKTSIKILLILFIAYGFYTLYNSYSNTITLLAVSEDQEGNPKSGSLVKLNLKITPGSGQIYTNLNTIEEIDTQISIINSNKIACEIFSLSCEKYNFYYTFEGSALILKGPSASTAIAILTAKTVKGEKIDDTTVITGSLNSGGIIGTVGGVEEKIKVAEEYNFTKILIPEFSDYNKTKLEDSNSSIKIIHIYDLIDAYNNFNGKTYQLKTENINNQNYLNEMKKLSTSICNRSEELKEKVNFTQIKTNTSLDNYKTQAEESQNYSIIAEKNQNYYSRGSFCYNSNINYKLIIENQKNLSFEKRNNELQKLENEINTKYETFMSEDYKKNIQTTNDFYVYLLMIDRIEEAKEYLKLANELELNSSEFNINTNSTTNNTFFILNITEKISNQTTEKITQINERKLILYSYASERYYTVLVWENFITHTGSKIKFTEDSISESCHKINHEISIKRELMDSYGINFLDSEINTQNKFENPFSNKYKCIYSGLELNGKINTLLNSVGVTDENQKNYTLRMVDFANTKVTLNSNGEFPLIPYMYSEYAKDLYSQDDFGSAMLYSNYALSYADLNLYLEEETKTISYFNWLMKELFSNPIFVIAILILTVFL